MSVAKYPLADNDIPTTATEADVLYYSGVRRAWYNAFGIIEFDEFRAAKALIREVCEQDDNKEG